MPLLADVCLWVDAATAARAAAILATATERLDADRGRVLPLGRVEVAREGGNSARVLLDGVEVDLAHLFVRGSGDWQNVGWLLPGCGYDGEPRTLQAEPFVAVTAGESRGAASPPRAAWIGIAELPTVVRQGTDEDPEPRPVDVYAEPWSRAAPIARLTEAGDLPTREWDYERAGAYVLEERDDWVRIRLASGAGWIRREDAGVVHPFAELARDGLAYLGAAWDGRLFAAPDLRGAARRLDDGWRRRVLGGDEVPVELLELRVVAGALWLGVRVTTNFCSGDEVRSFAEGWVPYAGRDGEPSVGIWSRGC